MFIWTLSQLQFKQKIYAVTWQQRHLTLGSLDLLGSLM